jgi:ribonuclease D
MKFPVHYITNNNALHQLVEKLKTLPAIGIDLEFDKNHYRYGFNLCLMQIFDGQRCYLIDPLSDITIDLIFPILEDEHIHKVCFAFSEDMRLLTYLGIKTKGVRDLAVARSLTGKPVLSLSNTLIDELNRPAQVSQQKSNWFNRPLTDDQKHYAALDVVDLFELNNTLIKQLEDLNRLSWFDQEMQQFDAANWESQPFEIVPEKDRKEFTLQQWMRYEKLMVLRDDIASELKKPAYKVIDKRIMKSLAIDPKQLSSWKKLKGVHPKFRNDAFEKKVSKALKEAQTEIENNKITEDESSRKRLTKAEKLIKSRKRNNLNLIKDGFFKSVKEKLSDEIGSDLCNFILSNRRMEEIVYQRTKLLPYQVELIKNAANQLNLELPKSVNGRNLIE